MEIEDSQRLLMVAFHYPPYQGGSGVHRTLKFSRYLPDYGWQPIILTARPQAYPQVGDEQLDEIPRSVLVVRTFAMDTARHLSVRGAYLRWMALPDRWISWCLGAIPAGLRLIRKYRPKVIWSTYPIATAHLIGFILYRLTGIPWVADFRDSMTEDNYPRDALTRRSYKWIEQQVAQYSCRLIFTAQAARQMYLNRYPWLSAEERCLLVPNGYDEEDFKGLEAAKPINKRADNPLRLLHAGVIYPDDRDPRAFFRALSRLKCEGYVDRRNLRVELRASGSEEYYSTIIRELAIEDLIHLLPALPYRQALLDCANADGLLLFQAASCNHQVPAKVYEYLRLQKPILALTSERGDTAALLRETGGATIVDLCDEQAIHLALPQFLSAVRNEVHPLPDLKKAQQYARHNQARVLAKYLSSLTDREGLINR